ncbi:MAG TPA: hypothetical protein VKK81_19690, partial [Candidatus Binatia bacterium]|nr:hypothetical protein [Candidatus Binatia bacterium]
MKNWPWSISFPLASTVIGTTPLLQNEGKISQLIMTRVLSIFFEHHFGVRKSDGGEDNPPLEQLPEIDLHLDEAHFDHLWGHAPGRVRELYLAGAHSGDPTELDCEIPVDPQLASRGLANCG